ncbi:hypothetical protein D3OALGB2SA_2496 [Olavius algarvensis associated proteobacterium Delta 3]|nr:hypothetical protein D3OALGB2SA_2496 [Olavius algarvensis associated proteobacterium Delta 3]
MGSFQQQYQWFSFISDGSMQWFGEGPFTSKQSIRGYRRQAG